MFQWIFIGLVIWFFYNRFKKKNELRRRQDHRYIKDDDFHTRNQEHASEVTEDDDYIDYEEVK